MNLNTYLEGLHTRGIGLSQRPLLFLIREDIRPSEALTLATCMSGKQEFPEENTRYVRA
jgi:hypothetical protein